MIGLWIAFALVLVAAIAVVLYHIKGGSWPAKTAERFEASTSASEALRRVAELASSQRGWAIAQSNASEQVRISCRPTWSTWKKTIVVGAEEQAASHSTIEITCTAPQVWDWGECARTVALIRRSIEAT
jgi:hypothetical protein